MSFWKKLFGIKDTSIRNRSTATQPTVTSNTQAPPILQIDSFFQVVGEGNSEKVKALLKDIPDLVFSKGKHGWTPLHRTTTYGTSYGKKDIAELLLAKGADVNAKDDSGDTPLHNAAEAGHKDMAGLFLANGADVNAGDKYSSTPLHVAAREGHKDVAELLLAKGADVNARDSYGNTPLHDASYRGHTSMVELLLANGVDVNAMDNEGATSLYKALREGHKGTVKLLRQHGGRYSDSEIEEALRNGNVATAKALLKNKPGEASALLSRFVKDKDARGIRLLLAADADVPGSVISIAEAAVQQARAERARLLNSGEPGYMLLPAERAAVNGETVAGAEMCLALLKAKVEGEIAAAVKAAIAKTGSPTMKDVGPVMKNTMSRFAGVRVDGKLVSEIVKRELAQSECPAPFANPQAKAEISAVPILTCTGCGRVYKIGDDAVAAALEYGLGLARGVVIISEGNRSDREDLVAAFEVSPETLSGAREKARQNWKIIQDSLTRGERRAWRCRACDKVNAYP